MRYSSFTRRIGGEGARAWEIHHRAVEAKRRGEDVIILSIGDPDFDTPDSIKQAAVAALDAATPITPTSSASRPCAKRSPAIIVGPPVKM